MSVMAPVNPNPMRPGRLDPNRYITLRTFLEQLAPEWRDEMIWASSIRAPETAEDFALEAIYVVICSGMKAQVAQRIYNRVSNRLHEGEAVHGSSAYRHKGKAKAIDRLWNERASLFESYSTLAVDAERLAFLGDLPWIGPITRYHLAKNFGLQVIKPDRWLERIAYVHRTTPVALCAHLSKTTGDPFPLVDTVLWRCANLGLIEVTETAVNPLHPALIEWWDLWYASGPLDPLPEAPAESLPSSQPFPRKRRTPCQVPRV